MRVSACAAGFVLLLAVNAVKAQDSPAVKAQDSPAVQAQDGPLVTPSGIDFRPYVYKYKEPDPAAKSTEDGRVADDPYSLLTPDSSATSVFTGTKDPNNQPGVFFTPYMFGDFMGITMQRYVAVPGYTLGHGAGAVAIPPATITAAGIPIAGQYTHINISSNESPRPVDRVFGTFNSYSEADRSSMPNALDSLSVRQETFGFEKTFFDGDWSVGLRVPYAQVIGFGAANQNTVGDATLIFKHAWLNDLHTGDIFSTGFALSSPLSGIHPVTSSGREAPNTVLLQPWYGFIVNGPDCYVQGFGSIAAPTDSHDPTIIFASVGAGYWLYRNDSDRHLTGIVPVVELNDNSPLNFSSSNKPIYFQEQLNVNVGSYFLFHKTTLGVAVGFPTIGPQPYHLDAIATLNIGF